jgi:hypothetical protein
MEGHTITDGQLAHRFAYHPPTTTAAISRHVGVRSACLGAAKELVELTGPPTREQSLAITKLEEAMFWANAAIAREISPNA